MMHPTTRQDRRYYNLSKYKSKDLNKTYPTANRHCKIHYGFFHNRPEREYRAKKYMRSNALKEIRQVLSEIIK